MATKRKLSNEQIVGVVRQLEAGRKPATAFLLELIAQLQSLGTVPMIDTRAYARWLAT